MAVDEPALRVGNELGETPPSGARILVNGFFGWHAAVTAAKAAVIDRQHRESEIVQLANARQLTGQVPARSVEIKDRRRIGLVGLPPPRMNVLVGGDRNIDLAYTVGQTGIPARITGNHAKHELALLLGELRTAANRERRNDAGQRHAAPDSPPIERKTHHYRHSTPRRGRG